MAFKKWKSCALSTQNNFTMEKNEVNHSSSSCCIAHARILFWMDGRNDGQTMIVADQLLAAKVINNTEYWVGGGGGQISYIL